MLVVLMTALVLSLAPVAAVSQEGDRVRGQIDLQPGDEFVRVLARSVAAPETATCPEEGEPFSLHPMLTVPQWACLALTNTGARPGVWRVDFNATSGQGVDIWLERGETRRQILTAPRGRTMGMTEGEGPWLASAPIAIAPQETVILRTKLGANVSLRVDATLYWARLVAEQGFDDSVTERAFAIATLLSASVLLIFFLSVFSRLLASKPAKDYALYFTVATLHFVSTEAYLAWALPALPVNWAMAPGRILEIAIFLLYYRFVASFVKAALGAHPIVALLRPVCWTVFGLFVLSVLIFGLSTALMVLPDAIYNSWNVPEWLLDLAIWGTYRMRDTVWFTLGAISAGYAIWAVVALVRARADGAWLFALGVGIIVGLYFLPYLQDALGIDRVTGFMLTRGLVVSDGLVFAAALVLQTFGLRSQRDAAVQLELSASQEKLALAEGLLAAKQGRDRAEALAERHRARLALTSHDLRQPLTSLRLALDAAEREAPALKAQLASSLDYLKSVLDDALAEARPTALTSTHAPAPIREAVPLTIILNNAGRMFADEAAAKGLSLALAETDLAVDADPVALIRALSNLLSNAIKYTQTGGIEVQVTAAEGRVSLTVEDTGPGLSPPEIAQIRQAYGRGGHGGDGEGIGLTSVQEIATDQGWQMEIDSTPGQGSRFSLSGLMQAVPDA